MRNNKQINQKEPEMETTYLNNNTIELELNDFFESGSFYNKVENEDAFEEVGLVDVDEEALNEDFFELYLEDEEDYYDYA